MSTPTITTENKSMIQLQQPSDEDKALFVDQCRCVEHMGKKIADLASTMQKIAQLSGIPLPIEIMSRSYHGIMEMMGEWINGTEAFDEEQDAWMDEIFDRSNEKFPKKGEQP